ncbi:MAG TPA: thymidine phosphorylase, partial [Burkholderiaceae bacterium]|nr:thymidine phosphorylase [Burkholderiaceae bacterium]
VLGTSCGNALELHEALAFLRGGPREPRLLALTRALSAELLLIGGLADQADAALAQVDAALADGRALERFGRMVAALGGPADFVERADAYLPRAPVQRVLSAARSGWIATMATREIGLLVVELGGGRRQAGDAVDHRVGLSGVAAIGQRVEAGAPLATVHAADVASAAAACDKLAALIRIADAAPAVSPVLIERIAAVQTDHAP